MKNKKLFAILTLVCFMFTLMPVAAFANADAETSAFVAVDGDQSVSLAKAQAGIKFDLDLNDAAQDPATTSTVYIWAETAAGAVTSALTGVTGATTATTNTPVANVFEYTANAANEELTLVFGRAGVYTVYASTNAITAPVDMETLRDSKFDCEFSTITVKSDNDDPDTYAAELNNSGVYVDANDTFAATLSVTPNNVMSDKVYVNFYETDRDADGNIIDTKPLKNETVYIETNSAAIEVNKASDVTNSQGEIDFKVAASIEGEYEVILTVDGVEWTVIVEVGNTNAAYIDLDSQPKAPQALYGSMANDAITFVITDINGNAVKGTANGAEITDLGALGIAGNNNVGQYEGKYIVLTEKPADSDLASEDLSLVWDATDAVWGIAGIDKDAEGDYAVKVILDNGGYATAEWTVKKFDKPVKMYFSAGVPAQVELGRSLVPQVKYVDKNGVEKAATDAEIVANGYAIEAAGNGAVTNVAGYGIQLKTDEKYVGQTITVTAVSEKYDLTCTNEVKIVEVAGLGFTYDALKVDVNNKVDFFLADAEGKMVRVTSNSVGANANADVKYVVVDKPEGAKVSVNQTKAFSNSEGQFAITSNMVGNVTVQVVVSVEHQNNAGVTATEYYTGVVVLPIGMEGSGDVVVMSIGSSYIVLNNEIKEIPAPAVIKDARTFVPFRAIGEAFGAEVAWDAATQSVTAELNGVTVVLTIGSNTYTVNGVEKVADVAPFIAGDGYTMVPARLIAEAFGAEVLFTTDANGATADVLFLM